MSECTCSGWKAAPADRNKNDDGIEDNLRNFPLACGCLRTAHDLSHRIETFILFRPQDYDGEHLSRDEEYQSLLREQICCRATRGKGGYRTASPDCCSTGSALYASKGSGRVVDIDTELNAPPLYVGSILALCAVGTYVFFYRYWLTLDEVFPVWLYLLWFHLLSACFFCLIYSLVFTFFYYTRFYRPVLRHFWEDEGTVDLNGKIVHSVYSCTKIKPDKGPCYWKMKEIATLEYKRQDSVYRFRLILKSAMFDSSYGWDECARDFLLKRRGTKSSVQVLDGSIVPLRLLNNHPKSAFELNHSEEQYLDLQEYLFGLSMIDFFIIPLFWMFSGMAPSQPNDYTWLFCFYISAAMLLSERKMRQWEYYIYNHGKEVSPVASY